MRHVNTTKVLKLPNTRPIGNEGESEVDSMEGGADFVFHPLMHTSAPGESSTNCGSSDSIGKV